MELDEQLQLAHLLLEERVCRICKEHKNLLDHYYRSRPDPTLTSSYSYECKECTIKRIIKKRKDKKIISYWEYPDW